MRLSVTLCTLFLFLFVSLNSAQVFRFNGQFNDPSGQSVGGTVFVSSVMVQLFDSPVVGQSGYIQMEPSVQVVDGLFSLDIGPGLPNLNQFRYLELTISGETLSPRVPILVAPLSLQSMDSERFGKLTTDEFLQIVGNAILEESNFITDSLTTGLSILSNDIVNNSQQIGSLDGRLSTVEQNAGSNAALQAVSQSLQSQDLRLQDLELVVGDSQSQLQALSSQLGALGSEQALQSAGLSSVQSDVLVLDSSLAQLQTTVSFLQGNLSQTPLDVLTSGEGSFSTSTVLHFEGSDMQLVIHSVLTDENAADKIVLFDSDGLEAFRVNAGGEVTASAYYGDGSDLTNLHSAQITDFVTAVQVIAGGPIDSTEVSDFATAVDGQISSALAGASFSSTQISDFVTATETVVSGTSLNSAQISDLVTVVDSQIQGSSFVSSQVSDFDTAVDSRITGAALNASQISDFSAAANAAVTLSKAAVGLGNVDDVQQIPMSYLNTTIIDTDTQVPSSAAVMAHVNSEIGSASSNYEPANPDLTNHLGDTSNPHSVTKAQVGLGSVDDVQQLAASALETVLSPGSDVNVPSSKAVSDYVSGAVSSLTPADVGLPAVQNIDVTTSFVQNPSADIGTHKIRGIDNQGLYLLNQNLDGLHISDSNGFTAINTYHATSALEIYGDENNSLSSVIRIRRATHAGAAGIQLFNDVANAGVVMGLGGGGFSDAPGRFFIKDANTPNVHMVVDSIGAVGINTVEPTARLDVKGALRLQTRTSTMGFDGTIRWNGSDLEVKQSGSWTSLTGGGGSSVFTNNTTNAVYDAGFLGLGAAATNPDEQLLVDGRIRLKNNNDNAGQDGTIRWTGSDLEVKNAGQWYSLTSGGSSTSAGGGSTNAFDDYALIIDKRAAGVHGGAAASGYTTRTLNTVVRDDGNIVQMTGDAFTLQPGSYEINADAPSNNTLFHVLVLVDHVTEQIITTGTAEFSQNNHSQTRSFLSTTMDLATTRTFELRHWANTANATTGLGVATNFGGDEVYTRLQIWKEDGYSEGGSSGSSNFADSGSNTNLTTGFLGINEPSPFEAIDVNGRIRLQTNNDNAGQDGTIRWTGSDLEVKNAGSWLSLTSGGNTTGSSSSGGSVPSGYSVFSGSPSPESGYTNTGRTFEVAAESSWTSDTSLAGGQSGGASATVGNEIYLLGGLDTSSNKISTVLAYQTTSANFITKANMNVAVEDGCAAYVNGKIYVFGGRNSSNTIISTIQKYDLAGNSWTTIGTTLNEGLWRCSAETINGKIYVTGGRNTGSSPVATLQVLDSVDDSITTTTAMNVARYGHGSAVQDGKLYVFGGLDASNKLTSLEVFDPSNSSWTSLTSAPDSRGHNKLVSVGGYLINIAGQSASQPTTTMKYNPGTDSWSAFTEHPAYVIQPYVGVVNDNIHYWGGWNGSARQSVGYKIKGPGLFYIHESDGSNSGGGSSSASTEIKDTDNDTLIDTASGGDSDNIILQTDGTLAMVITSDNRVGIGTNQTQGGTLTIQSQSTHTSILMNTTQPNYITGFDLYNGNAPKWALHSRGTADGANLDDRFSIQNGSASEVMTLHQTGGVGIGTNTPNYHLDVTNPAATTTIMRVDSSATNQVAALFLSSGGGDDWHLASRGLADAPNNRLSIYDQSNYEAMSFLQGGKVGISKTNPTTALHVGGGATVEGGLTVGFSAAPVDGTIQLGDGTLFWKFNGGVNPHMAWDANDYWGYDRVANDYFWISNGTEKMRILGDGKVGIGTSSPAELLHVKNASGHAQATIEGGSGAFGSTLEFKNNGASKWLLQSRGTIDGPNDRFTIHNAGAASQVFTILQTGAVGIGTSTPNQKLHVNGNSFVSGSTQFGDALFGADMITFSPNPSIYFDGTDYLLFNRATNDIAYATGNVEKIRFTSAGNLGINNVAPSQKLDVGGNAEVTGGLNVGVEVASPTAGHVYLGDANNHIGWFGGNPAFHFDTNDYIQYMRGSDDMRFVVNNADVMRLDSNGRMGINTTNNYAKVVIDKESESISTLALVAQPGIWNNLEFRHGGVSQWHLSSRNTLDTPNDRFGIFNSSSTELFTILQSGNVGIGNNDPDNKLTVNGDIRIGTGGTNGCLRRADTTVLVGTCASDERFKKSVESYSDSLSRLTKLRPVTYFWRSDEFPEKSFGKERSSGFIAQEMEKVFPELVSTTEDGFKAVNYGIELRMHTIQAIKELNEKLEEELAEKDQKIDDLIQLNKTQELRLQKLERQIKFLIQNQQ